MKKIEDYGLLSQWISAQLKAGMCTNAFYTPQDYQKAIAEGSLCGEKWEGGLALLWGRAGYDRLSFWLTDCDGPIPFVPKRTTVLEIAARPKDAKLHEAGKRWEEAGFTPLFERLRLSHGPWEAPEAPWTLAQAADAPAVSSLLAENFHPQAGCLPTQGELLEELEHGHFLCLRDEGGQTVGLLHYLPQGRATKIQHLAVSKALRRTGGGSALLAGYQALSQGKRSMVWTQADNAPALAFYEKHGYTPDGWTSRVWLWNEGGSNNVKA